MPTLRRIPTSPILTGLTTYLRRLPSPKLSPLPTAMTNQPYLSITPPAFATCSFSLVPGVPASYSAVEILVLVAEIARPSFPTSLLPVSPSILIKARPEPYSLRPIRYYCRRYDWHSSRDRNLFLRRRILKLFRYA
jgi:hypothetical protein